MLSDDSSDDSIVRAVLPASPAIPEHVKYGVQGIWVTQILAANEKRVRKLNAKLVARGLSPIVLS